MADEKAVAESGFWTTLMLRLTASPQATAKFITTLSDQLALWAEPYHIRRKGEAEADVLVAQARSEAKIAVIEVQNKLAIRDIRDRAAERRRRHDEARQQNLEAIAAQAAEKLSDDVSDDPVDPDWLTQFFNHSQDVSNQEMQSVWGRILAGEIARPGSFSLRTLNVVRMLTKYDAALFSHFCSIIWRNVDQWCPILPSSKFPLPFPDVRLSFGQIMNLEVLGLVMHRDEVSPFVLNFPRPALRLDYFRKPHFLRHRTVEPPQSEWKLPVGEVFLTDVGHQLVPIAGGEPNEQYRVATIDYLRTLGWDPVDASPSPNDAPSPDTTANPGD